jgi:hypothetical protein
MRDAIELLVMNVKLHHFLPARQCPVPLVKPFCGAP